jgi:hypothetical protein
LTRSSPVRTGLAARARIVLLAAAGLPNAEIARRTRTSRPTVVDWRPRYDPGGIRALDDQPRSSRPPEIDEIELRFGLRPHRRHHRVVNRWNERCEPFVRTNDADTIIANADRKSSSGI